MSSNFFLSAAGSASGQLASSWWQKMTFSRIARDTPRSSGISWSSSAHRVEIVAREPASASASSTPSTPSSVFIVSPTAPRLLDTWMLRTQPIRTPFVFRKRSRICALTWLVPAIEGS